MKKTLVSALTSALVIGAASTTFAAANPFEDVPADHWAYDAVAQLAADGVIEGYGDGTYRGDQEITRYEMAQMVARAMSKSNVSGADKAMIDKLAAEFADELKNLGVRVAALEKKVDNVKFYGLFRYTYERERQKNDGNYGTNHQNTNDFRLRLQMSTTINKHWTGKARVEYKSNMNSGKNATNGDVYLNRAYVEGKYGATTIDLGRFPGFTDVDGGLVFDDEVSGGQVVFGNKANVKLLIGRYYDNYAGTLDDKTVSYQSIEVNSDPNKKFRIGAAYHHVDNADLFRTSSLGGKQYKDRDMSIWEIGAGYRFDKNFAINAAYAKNTKGDIDSKYLRAWTAELGYKGAKADDPGSFGLFAAYRHVGNRAVIMPTYNPWIYGKKGWHVGAKYTVFRNIVGMVEYFNGKVLENNVSTNTVFARVECYF